MHKVRLDMKDSYDLALESVPPVVREEYGPALDAYFSILGEFAVDYMDTFPHLKTHTRSCSINESPNIQHYPPNGGFFEEHFESAGPSVAKRVLTFQTYLNDIEEGGGTHFVYQDYTARPARGRTVLWPAGYTHVHRGQVAPREDKYIITGWWSYDEPGSPGDRDRESGEWGWVQVDASTDSSFAFGRRPRARRMCSAVGSSSRTSAMSALKLCSIQARKS
jgi:hypothetical protein